MCLQWFHVIAPPTIGDCISFFVAFHSAAGFLEFNFTSNIQLFELEEIVCLEPLSRWHSRELVLLRGGERENVFTNRSQKVRKGFVPKDVF